MDRAWPNLVSTQHKPRKWGAPARNRPYSPAHTHSPAHTPPHPPTHPHTHTKIIIRRKKTTATHQVIPKQTCVQGDQAQLPTWSEQTGLRMRYGIYSTHMAVMKLEYYSQGAKQQNAHLPPLFNRLHHGELVDCTNYLFAFCSPAKSEYITF